MKRRWMLLIGLAVCAAPIVNAAGSTYSVSSVQLFSQFNPSSPVPPSLGYNFLFSALAPTTATLNGFQVSQPLPANAVSHDFEFEQAFTTAAARNAYYPNTTLGYTLSGPAFCTVSMTTANSLPISIPYVLGGTWQNRMLMIDADRGGLINLSPFPQYGTFSVGSRMRVTVTSLNSDNFSLIQPIATTSIPGYAVSSIPFDHCGIPAKALKPGLCYLCTVSYEAITSLDITTNPGTAAIGTNGEVMNFFIAAIPTASVPAPAITTQPTNQVVPQGGNATFSASMSYGGASQPANTAFIWYANGLPVDYGGSKYTLGADGTLTINNVGTADAGTYALVAVNAGGLAQTSNVSLAVTTSGLAAPTITVQPLNIIVNGGSTAALKVTATSANPIS